MSSFIIANYVSKHLKIGSVVFSHNQPSHTLFPENIDFQLVLLTLMGELLMLLKQLVWWCLWIGWLHWTVSHLLAISRALVSFLSLCCSRVSEAFTYEGNHIIAAMLTWAHSEPFWPFSETFLFSSPIFLYFCILFCYTKINAFFSQNWWLDCDIHTTLLPSGPAQTNSCHKCHSLTFSLCNRLLGKS